jgi:hypothetical protein
LSIKEHCDDRRDPARRQGGFEESGGPPGQTARIAVRMESIRKLAG